MPYGPDDGTVSASGILSSLVFAPEIVLPAVRALLAPGGTDAARTVQASGFNATAHGPGAESATGMWVSEGEFGLDQGMVVLMVENFRSGLLWRLLRSCPFMQTGLRRAGFRGGWLNAASPS